MSLAPSLDLTPYLMLFVVLDPVGILPYYQAVVSRVPERDRDVVLSRALAFAFAMLVAFALIGDLLFRLLGVTIADFKIAAGVILAIYAIAAIFEVHIGSPKGEPAQLAIFPLATPLLAGPGSISTVIYIKYVYGLATALAATTVNIILAYPILASASILLRVLGRHGALFIDKFMSLILAGFAVSLIREGIQVLASG
ncbi:MAG: MarC family protein [Desulfurococcales archaeon]|nr:MarC family protein [Desulfurococcales archaeon]